MARAAVGQANNLQQTAGTNAAQNTASAAGVNSTLNPFLTSELLHPQGYSQGDQTAMLSAGQAGTGGATAGIAGQANLQAARTRNAGGFGAALDAAARSRQQASAGSSEQIAADNANLKQKQQQEAATGLQGLYGTDSSNALKALGIQDQAIGTEADAGKSGWLQNATGILNSITGAGKSAAALGLKF
jgi:hypothetical protein